MELRDCLWTSSTTLGCISCLAGREDGIKITGCIPEVHPHNSTISVICLVNWFPFTVSEDFTALAGRNFVPLPPSLPSGNVNWESKGTVGVYNVSVKNGEKCDRVRWRSPVKSGIGRATSWGEKSQWDGFGAWGSCSGVFKRKHALHVRVLIQTLWLTEMERMRSKPKWEMGVVSPKLGWQSWNSCDSPSGWFWPKLSYKNKTSSSTWIYNNTSQYCTVEPIWTDYITLQQL